MRQSVNKESTVVIISSGKKSDTVVLGTGRYWEIAGELIWRGAERLQAMDNAKWCDRAPAGSEIEIAVKNGPAISLKIQRKEERV